ncbi:MAG TPA: ORF6N domain-containing protein [Prolixibacteraceae bacterium]
MAAENSSLMIPDERILSKIYLIRGQKVMLDRNLAELFSVKAIRLREQVRRNPDKFPEHFMFQLTETEVEIMVSQNAIPSKKHLGGSLPFAFSEYGVLQLANVLKSNTAVQMSIKIIEIFVRIRQMLTDTLNLKLEIEEIRKNFKIRIRRLNLFLITLTN